MHNDKFYKRTSESEIATGYFAKIIESTECANTGVRMTTMHLRLPFYITPELLRHRVFSFSSASTRAIPTKRFIKQVRENPAMPFYWGKNQPGMQAAEEVSRFDIEKAEQKWRTAAFLAAEIAEEMLALGLHKEVINKVLFPYIWCDILVTGTTFSNFFDLRRHNLAAHEMQRISGLAADAMVMDNPRIVETTEPETFNMLHLPFVTAEEKKFLWPDLDYATMKTKLCMISAARCARISYSNFDGVVDADKDYELAEKLMGSRPMHASPFEHVAQVTTGTDNYILSNLESPFLQYRKVLESMAEGFVKAYTPRFSIRAEPYVYQGKLIS